MDSLTNVDSVRKAIANENLEVRGRFSPRDPMGRWQVVCAGTVDGGRNSLLETKDSNEGRGEVAGADKDVLFGYRNVGVGNTYLR